MLKRTCCRSRFAVAEVALEFRRWCCHNCSRWGGGQLGGGGGGLEAALRAALRSGFHQAAGCQDLKVGATDVGA